MDDLERLKEMAGLFENDGDEAYNVEDASGDGYAMYYRGHDARLFVEKNGVGIASASVSGGGVLEASVRDPGALLEALWAFAENNQR